VDEGVLPADCDRTLQKTLDLDLWRRFKGGEVYVAFGTDVAQQGENSTGGCKLQLLYAGSASRILSFFLLKINSQ
jgi:hypothetical protein